MAKLFSFTICDSINNLPASGGTVPMLIAPQIALRPQFVPGNFSFGLAIGMSEIDLHISNKLKLVIQSPDGNVIHDSGETDLPIISKGDTLPQKYQGFMMCVDIRNLVIPCEGEYIFTFYLNGECVAKQSVPIFKRVSNGYSNLYNRKFQYSNPCSTKCKNLLRYGSCAGTCGFNYWYSFCPYANFCNKSEYLFLD